MKIVVFDLDETLGYFTEFGIFWDSLVQYLFHPFHKSVLEISLHVVVTCIVEFSYDLFGS